MIARANGLLTEESRKNLSRLLGQDIYFLLTRCIGIKAGRNYVTVPDISFLLRTKTSNENFLIVRPVWEEDENLLDYGWLEIVIGDTPEKISYDYHPKTRSRTIGYCSDIKLIPASPIRRITLFQKNLFSDASGVKNWPYHFALHFQHKERFEYIISYRWPNSLNELEFTFDKTEIESVSKNADSKEIFE